MGVFILDAQQWAFGKWLPVSVSQLRPRGIITHRSVKSCFRQDSLGSASQDDNVTMLSTFQHTVFHPHRVEVPVVAISRFELQTVITQQT